MLIRVIFIRTQQITSSVLPRYLISQLDPPPSEGRSSDCNQNGVKLSLQLMHLTPPPQELCVVRIVSGYLNASQVRYSGG